MVTTSVKKVNGVLELEIYRKNRKYKKRERKSVMDFPPFHQNGLFLVADNPWNKQIDPHLSLIAVLVIIAVIFFFENEAKKGQRAG